MHSQTDSVRIVLFEQDHTSFTALSEADDPENLKLPGGKFEGEELPHEAAARELAEELGLKPEDVGLTLAGELTNDDGKSKRYIYRGIISASGIKPSDEIHQTGTYTEDTVPEGKNRGHILSAVALARSSMAESN